MVWWTVSTITRNWSGRSTTSVSHALLARTAQQPFEQPRAIGIELGHAAHVRREADLTAPGWAGVACITSRSECVGAIGRPVAGGCEIKPVAAHRRG